MHQAVYGQALIQLPAPKRSDIPAQMLGDALPTIKTVGTWPLPGFMTGGVAGDFFLLRAPAKSFETVLRNVLPSFCY